MKKILMIMIFGLLLSIVSINGTSKTEAATRYFEDNYNANIVAVGNVTDNDCLTEYYVKVSDGNAVIIFDLLYRSEFGYFGVVAGSNTTLGKFSTMTDYMLFGKDVLSSCAVSSQDDIFVAGKTYRVTFDVKNSKWKVESKEITEDNSCYMEVLSVSNSFSSSNVAGLACYSNDYKAATAVIDNLKITSLSGSEYVSNDFGGSSTIKEGSMVSLVTDSETGTKIYTGSVTIQKLHVNTVRFMSESGEILSEENISLYGTATQPVAPEKEGYTFDHWNKSVTCILEDCSFYPVYKLAEKQDSGDKEDKKENEQENEAETVKKSSCASNIFSSGIIIFTMILTVAVLKYGRKANEKNN